MVGTDLAKNNGVSKLTKKYLYHNGHEFTNVTQSVTRCEKN